jgi:hypothetical protein
MTWEEKLGALGALCTWGYCELFMRSPGIWGINVKGVERKEEAILSGGCISGHTPEEAVEKAWEWATDKRYYIVRNAMGKREAFRWNGYMWLRIEEE